MSDTTEKNDTEFNKAFDKILNDKRFPNGMVVDEYIKHIVDNLKLLYDETTSAFNLVRRYLHIFKKLIYSQEENDALLTDFYFSRKYKLDMTELKERLERSSCSYKSYIACRIAENDPSYVDKAKNIIETDTNPERAEAAANLVDYLDHTFKNEVTEENKKEIRLKRQEMFAWAARIIETSESGYRAKAASSLAFICEDRIEWAKEIISSVIDDNSEPADYTLWLAYNLTEYWKLSTDWLQELVDKSNDNYRYAVAVNAVLYCGAPVKWAKKLLENCKNEFTKVFNAVRLVEKDICLLMWAKNMVNAASKNGVDVCEAAYLIARRHKTLIRWFKLIIEESKHIDSAAQYAVELAEKYPELEEWSEKIKAKSDKTTADAESEKNATR